MQGFFSSIASILSEIEYEHVLEAGCGEGYVSEFLWVSKRYVLATVPREPIWCMLNLCRGKYIKELGNTPGHIQYWSTQAFLKIWAREGVIGSRTPLPWTVVLVEKGI